MTTIAAVQGPSWSVIGYDSQVSESEGRKYLLPSDAGKCVEVGPFILGVAGDFRAVNILTHSFSPPDPGKNKTTTLDKYMITKFVPSLKKCFDENFYGKDGEHGSSLIVSVNGVIYEIGSNFDCIRDGLGLYATGTGGLFALGAMYALDSPSRKRTTTEAKDIVRRSIEAAAFLDSATSDPVTVIVQRS